MKRKEERTENHRTIKNRRLRNKKNSKRQNPELGSSMVFCEMGWHLSAGPQEMGTERWGRAGSVVQVLCNAVGKQWTDCRERNVIVEGTLWEGHTCCSVNEKAEEEPLTERPGLFKASHTLSSWLSRDECSPVTYFTDHLQSTPAGLLSSMVTFYHPFLTGLTYQRLAV